MAKRNSSHPLHLCPGIVFSLLYVNRRTAQAYRDTGITEKEETPVSQNSISLALTRLALTDFKQPKDGSLDSDVSNLKNCKREPGAATPFYWESYKTELEGRMRDDYYGLLADWNKLLVSVLDIYNLTHNRQLVADHLLSLIEVDEDFPGYDDPVQGRFIPREELLAERPELLFQTFTLGIWVWICRQRPSNKIDVKALRNWHTIMFHHQAYVRLLTEEEIKKAAPFSAEAEEETVETEYYPEQDKDEAEPVTFEACVKEPAEKVHPAAPEGPQTEYAEYMRRAQKKYGWLKTFLHPECLTRFADCYVCPEVEKVDIEGDVFNAVLHSYIFTMDLKAALQEHRPIVLTGVGGLGKSMLLRSLLLSAIEQYPQVQLVPVLVPLRDAEEDCSDIEALALSELQQLWPDAEAGQFHAELKRGRFLFLLDGLDEVKNALRPKVVKLLNRFTETWQQNKFIATSRLDDDCMDLEDYKLMRLEPFDTAQALEFVDKSNFHPDAPEITEEFKQLLVSGQLESRASFTGNPLLLSILLLTYGKYRKIPSAMHEFYEQAYDVLARRHDKSKEGFQREWKTGLTPDRFADVLGEFCARTYEDEQYTFTPAELERHFSRLSIVEKGAAFTASDFVDDLVNGMCLMFLDGDRYAFIHRSFQEYFCARYYSRADRQKLERFGLLLDHRFACDSQNSSLCLPMLYEMIPQQIEEYILSGALRRAVGCGGEEGYRAFLQKFYPHINYCIGEVPRDQALNSAISYLYRFAAARFGFHQPGQLGLPAEPDFLKMYYVLAPTTDGKRILAAHNPQDGLPLPNSEVKWAGSVYDVMPAKLFQSADKYPELVAALCAPDCPLRVEYDRVREYTRDLQEKYSRQRARMTYSLFE